MTPYQFSIASGQGSAAGEVKAKIRRDFAAIDREPRVVSRGPDLLGFSDHEWWAIECKRSGAGKPQTQRNNFDRALASVVSYYDSSPSSDIPALDASVFTPALHKPRLPEIDRQHGLGIRQRPTCPRSLIARPMRLSSSIQWCENPLYSPGQSSMTAVLLCNQEVYISVVETSP